MVKNNFFRAISVSILMTAAASTHAAAGAQYNPHFNLGAEASIINKTNHSSMMIGNRLGINVLAGARLNEAFGAEVGAGYTGGRKIANGRYQMGNVRNYYIDALGYLPLDRKVDLIAAVGLGRAHFKNTIDTVTSKIKSGGLRLGVGAQHNFNAYWSLRAMLRHQRRSGLFFRNNTSVAVAAIYKFV